MATKSFWFDFAVLIYFFNDMISCRPNIVVMYMERGLSSFLIFVKTQYYSNNHMCMKKLNTTFSSWKTKSQSVYVKGHINLDIAQKEHDI